jgi:hypothetical protein
MSHLSSMLSFVPNPAAPVFQPASPASDPPQIDRRRRPRAQLVMPVRVRWLGPFGLETEVTRANNVSRGGLLVSGTNPRQAGSLLWATFPYDAAVAFAESETPGRVVRCSEAAEGDHLVAVALNPSARIPDADAPVRHDPVGRNPHYDRKRQRRSPAAFCVRIIRLGRPSDALSSELQPPVWSEEAMTINISPSGMLFCSLRIYQIGERLVIVTQSGMGRLSGERPAHVVRVGDMHPDSPLSQVAVEFLP